MQQNRLICRLSLYIRKNNIIILENKIINLNAIEHFN